MANRYNNQDLDEAMIYAPEPDPMMVEDVGLPPGFGMGLIQEEDPEGWDEDMAEPAEYCPPCESEFYENLAEYLPEGKRDFLAQTIIKWVQQDQSSRADWAIREAAGIVALGVTDQTTGGLSSLMPDTGIGSDVTHPGLAQAQINFWARSFGELWQSGRPAKSVVLGYSDAEKEAQGKRAEDYLNYLYTTEMPSAASEFSRMLYWLPISGSKFRKPYFDPIEGTLCVETINTADFVKPYSANDLRKAARFTHIVRLTRNDLRRMIADGYYLDAVRNRPEIESTESDITTAALDEAVGKAPNQDGGEHETEYDQRDVLFECYPYLDLGDYDWDDPEAEGWGLPYIVTVHKTDQKVLSIRRNWRQSDLRKRRRLSVIEYKFLPGDGYGYGLLHVAGGLAMAQTGFLRYLLDACECDTTGRFSGFISQDIVGMAEAPALEWGKFKKIPASGDDIKKAIWTPDYKWSANNITAILQYLDSLMGEIVSSTQSMVGEDIKNIPVGTVLAIIEQKTKPFVTIFQLLHASFREELKAVSELVADYLPQRYPYAIAGADQEVMASDFDDRVDITPASDPNVVTALARNAQAQAVVELVKGDPEVFGPADRIRAYRRFLEVLRVQDVDDILPAEGQPLPGELADQAQVQPDPAVAAEADIARQDAAAVAGEQRKDAVAVSEQRRADAQAIADAQRQMQINTAAQANGDRAIQAAGQGDELAATAQEIMQLAAARQRQMAGDVIPPGVIR